MESIRIWLNGDRLYSSGVKLFQQYGKDPLLKRLFAEPVVTDFKKSRLTDALTSLLTVPADKTKIAYPEKEKSIAIKEASEKAASTKSGTTRWSSSMDETETALYNQWKPVFDELMHLCSVVGNVALQGAKDTVKKQEACKMVLRILDLDDECEDFYSRRDHYLKHGQLPETKPYGEPCQDPAMMPQKLANHERYVRDFRKKLEKDVANTQLAETLKKHLWFVEYYKKILKKA